MPKKRGRRRVRQQAQVPVIRQLEPRQLRNRFTPISPLDDEQLEMIHQASMTLIEQHGVEVLGAAALDKFRDAGATVDENGVVRMEPELVLQTIALAPDDFDMTPRNPANRLSAGGNAINFGLVSGPPNVHDNINGRRAGNLEDYKKVVSLGQHFNVLSFFGNQAIAPTDLPANTRHLDTTQLNLTLSDKVFFAQGIGGGRARDAVAMCAIAKGLKLEEMVGHPTLGTNININSPRKLDDSMAYGAMQMAMLGQPVVVTPFTLMGAMTPATMAAALTQQNAEALLGICLVQLTRPGTPVIYGGFTSNVDMRSGAPAFGTPENTLANIAGGQLARKYSLPHRTSACNASNSCDAQATWETQMSLWGAVMGHGNFVYHAAGWLEGGLVASLEKIVLDCEMLQHMSAMLQPIKVDAAEIGLDAIGDIDPGGHFFGSPHTMERFKTAFYEPFLSDWQNYENWVIAGEKSATDRATELWQEALKEYEAPPIDPAISEELDAYVRKRKEALGGNEPELVPCMP